MKRNLGLASEAFLLHVFLLHGGGLTLLWEKGIMVALHGLAFFEAEPLN